MTKQTKVALAVVAFVITAAVARRVGQFEMKEQTEKQIAVLQGEVAGLRTSVCGLYNRDKSSFDAIIASFNDNIAAIKACHNKNVKFEAEQAYILGTAAVENCLLHRYLPACDAMDKPYESYEVVK